MHIIGASPIVFNNNLFNYYVATFYIIHYADSLLSCTWVLLFIASVITQAIFEIVRRRSFKKKQARIRETWHSSFNPPKTKQYIAFPSASLYVQMMRAVRKRADRNREVREGMGEWGEVMGRSARSWKWVRVWWDGYGTKERWSGSEGWGGCVGGNAWEGEMERGRRGVWTRTEVEVHVMGKKGFGLFWGGGVGRVFLHLIWVDSFMVS